VIEGIIGGNHQPEALIKAEIGCINLDEICLTGGKVLSGILPGMCQHRFGGIQPHHPETFAEEMEG